MSIQLTTGPTRKAAPRPRHRHHHHVYVVKLDDRVWNEPRFRKANPDHQLGRPFVYVGMTGLDPDLRFDKHKAGIQANRFVFGQADGPPAVHPRCGVTPPASTGRGSRLNDCIRRPRTHTADPMQTYNQSTWRPQTGHSTGSRMNSSGYITRSVVLSRNGVLSFSTSWSAALVCTRSSARAGRVI